MHNDTVPGEPSGAIQTTSNENKGSVSEEEKMKGGETFHQEHRRIVCAVDDSDTSEHSVRWFLRNLYKEGDEIHLIHVIPRFAVASTFGAPALDLAPLADPESYRILIESTKRFLSKRFANLVKEVDPAPVVHICKADQDPDSIGAQVCRLVSSLHADFLVMAKHQKSKFHQLLMGSVSRFCVENCKRPVVLVS